MITRDEAIKRHIGEHVLSLRAVIEAHFFKGKTSDHVLNRLVEAGKLQVRKGLPGGLSYYQLSLPETKALGFPEHRARPKRSRALREALAVLWFCCMGDKSRRRIGRRELGKEFGKGRGFGRPHTLELEDDYPIVRRVYTPGPNSRDKHLLKSIRFDYEQAVRNQKLAEWVQDTVFRFTILVETKKRKERIEERIRRQAMKHLPIDVFIVPGPESLADEVKKGAPKC